MGNKWVRIVVSLVLVAWLGCCLWLLWPVPELPSAPVKISGALRALNTWSAERDYPYQTHSDQAYQLAWQKMQTFHKAEVAQKVSDPWKPLGPANLGGRTLVLAFDPENSAIMYAGSASGGLWRSETGGMGENAWKRVETGFPILGVGAIAINPHNRNQIFVGTGEVYGYSPTGPGIGNRLTRGSYGMGILKSEDGGKSWRLSLDWRYHHKRGIQNLAFSHDGSRVWAATTEGIFSSDNDGKTWELRLDVPMGTSISVHPEISDEVMVACGGFNSPGKGIYRTQDGGLTWVKGQHRALTLFLGKIILDRAPTNPNVVYASVGHRNSVSGRGNDQTEETWLLRTDNGGLSWSQRNNFDYSAYQGWYSHFVKVSPENEDQVFVGGVRLYSSNDTGRTLEPVPYSVTDDASMVDLHAAYILPETGRGYIACDQGIYTTLDGIHFEPAMHGYQTTQFYRGTAQAPGTKDFMAGTPQDRLGTFYSGTSEWQATSLGHEGGYTIFNPENNQIFLMGFAYLQWLERYGTDDYGQPVPVEGENTDLFQNTNFNAPLAQAPTHPDIVYAGRDVLYRTTDFASSWTLQTPVNLLDGNPIGRMAVSHQNPDRVYLATSPRYGPMHVYRTSDGGVSVTDISAGLPDRWPSSLAVDPRDDQVVYVTFSGFGTSHLFKSDNGGTTWQDLDRGNLPDLPVNAIFLDPDYPDHLYLAHDLGILVSLDGGATWLRWQEGLPEATFAVDFVTYRPDRTLRLVTHGNGIFENTLLEPNEEPLPQSRLVYPWISHNAGLFESTLVVNNLSGLPASLSLTARRADGSSETVSRQVAANGMLAETASSLFPQMGSGEGYSVVVEAAVEGLYGRWVTSSLLAASGGSPSQGVAVAMPEDGEAEDELWGSSLVFSYLPTTPDFLSAPVLINLGKESTDITLVFRNATGQEIARAVLADVPPLVPMAALASDWIPPDQTQTMMTAHAANGLIAGVSFVFNNVFKETAIGNAPSLEVSKASQSRLMYPWVSNAEGEYRSTLVVNNLSSEEQSITLTARRENGEQQTVTRQLPASGFLAEESHLLFDAMGSGSGMSVTVEAASDQVYGKWVTRNLRSASGGSPSLGVAIRKAEGQTLSRHYGKRLLLGYLPANSEMVSAPVLVNLGSSTAAITLDFVSPDGQILLRDTQTLGSAESLKPFARVLTQLLPDAPPEVYLVAHSKDADLTGVCFVFNQGFFEPALGNAQAMPWR